MTEVRGRGWRLEPSAAESARFGIAVERLTVDDDATYDDALPAGIDGSAADVIVARWCSQSTWVPPLLSRSDRQVLPASGLVYWELDAATAHAAAPQPGATLREVSGAGGEHDVAAALAGVVADAFSGYLTHYSYNPLFPAADVLAGYQEWAVSTAVDPAGIALLLEVDGAPAGMATARRVGDDVDILLAGIASAYQGGGLYPLLLDRIRAIAAGSGAARVVISTQTSNVRVQSVWSRLGWRPYRTLETAHLVAVRPA